MKTEKGELLKLTPWNENVGVCKFWKSLSICNKLDTVLSAVVFFWGFYFPGKLSQISQIISPCFFGVSIVCN